MKIYFIQLIYFYAIYSLNVAESSIEHVEKVEPECYCPCLATDSTIPQTTNDHNDTLFTTSINYLSTLYTDDQKATETLLQSTQGETEKVEETMSTTTEIQYNRLTKRNEYTSAATIKNELTTQSSTEETTTEKISDKMTSEIETNTIYNNETSTKKEENLKTFTENTKSSIDENESSTTDENAQSTKYYETTDYPEAEKNGVSSSNINETQKIINRLKVITKIPSTRLPQDQSSTKISLPPKEEKGIVFKIYIFIQNIKEIIINNIFY